LWLQNRRARWFGHMEPFTVLSLERQPESLCRMGSNKVE
jgi:hypothetical protein